MALAASRVRPRAGKKRRRRGTTDETTADSVLNHQQRSSVNRDRSLFDISTTRFCMRSAHFLPLPSQPPSPRMKNMANIASLPFPPEAHTSSVRKFSATGSSTKDRNSRSVVTVISIVRTGTTICAASVHSELEVSQERRTTNRCSSKICSRVLSWYFP